MCSSDGNLTSAQDAVITVETVNTDVVVDPGGFWTGHNIAVHGRISALLQKDQMTGVNGLLSSTGVYVSKTAILAATGAIGISRKSLARSRLIR